MPFTNTIICAGMLHLLFKYGLFLIGYLTLTIQVHYTKYCFDLSMTMYQYCFDLGMTMFLTASVCNANFKIHQNTIYYENVSLSVSKCWVVAGSVSAA